MTSSPKRRKLDGQSATPPLSAFAARKTLTASREEVTNSQNPSQSLDVNKSVASVATSSKVPEEGFGKADKSLPVAKPSVDDFKREEVDIEHLTSYLEEHDGSTSRENSPELLVEAPAIILSSFKPSKSNTRELDSGALSLKLDPGERLIILGECDISVQKGRITIMGATIQPLKRLYRISAPSSHSLPVIRCPATEMDHAEIQLHQCQSGLGGLSSLSPLFDKLWNSGSASLGNDYKELALGSKKSSFQILLTSKDGPPKAFLQPIISAPEWNQALSKFSVHKDKRPPAIMICGPKSSGKSTFAKILINKLLSDSEITKSLSSRYSHGVALLDLDPGQPEYAVPGQLSLVHLKEPNFGPPFSHPWPRGQNRLIRSHTIGSITPAQDPELYMRCAVDLAAHYDSLLSQFSKCPLIINTPGWVLGTGLELLVELITKFQPSDVIYMSQEGPWDVVNSLRGAAKKTPVYTLPSQTCEYTTRTAAHLRTMQTMSYFHIDSASEAPSTWNSLPLTAVRPWEIKYAGEGIGILGILTYGEQPSADCLIDSINGSIVAVVLIEDMDAIPGLKQHLGEEYDTGRSVSDRLESHESATHRPLIISAPESALPYFNPLNSITLLPQHSRCLGLALVRGVDITRGRLQVLTPVSTETIEEIDEQGKRIVLVSGKFDTPGWAYTEEMVRSIKRQKRQKQGKENNDSGDNELDTDAFGTSGQQDAPWVERLEGSQGRGIGARVWRVRRDLGRQDGGE